MLVRTKNKEFGSGEKSVLLQFLRGELGLKQGEGGIKAVADGLDMVCFASVPFCAPLEGGEKMEGAVSVPEGIDWTFSTYDKDRFGERVDPSGWEYGQYVKNPVIQWAHLSYLPAIGRADGVCADDRGLHGRIVFNDKSYDPFGWAIGERVKAGVIRAGSVGFRVLEIEIPSKADSKDGTNLIFRKQELLEFSICNVPANPYALTKLEAPSPDGAAQAGELERQFWGGFLAIRC
jgi:HK97 family phage prohead protease